jgi:diacylglycerol O-acyltransferase / wax synthase
MARRPFYEPLSTSDRPFLVFESGNCHMHLGGTTIFEPGPLATPGGGIDADRIRTRIASRLHLIPRYRQRLAWVPVEQSPVWVDDEHFNIFYHVRHTAVPHPGTERQLQQLAARIMSQPLDRSRPLWEVWVVEGLEGNRFALLMKTHHAIADGVSGVDLLSVLLSNAPDETIEEPPQWHPRPAPEPRDLLRDEWIRRLRAPLGAWSAVRALVAGGAQVRDRIAQGLTAVWDLVDAGFRLPAETPLNQPVGPHRRLDWLALELADVKAVKNRVGGTVNDVVLATVTGAVRRFLRRRGVDVQQLVYKVAVPVSVRTEVERGTFSNRASAWLAQLPIGERNPLRRYRAIVRTTAHLKESRQELGADVLGQVAEMVGAAFLTLGVRLVSRLAPYNLIVTNIPGPPFPLYLLGARLIAGYPLVPLFEHQGLGIALFSYDGKLFCGLNADWDQVPDLGDFVDALRASFLELADAAAETDARAAASGR